MAVLVTGGAGFIGSHLVEALLERGEEVWVIDNLSTGDLKNIWHLFENPRFHFVRGDILDEQRLAETMRYCHKVYHLAAAVGVKLVVHDPLGTLETNVRGTENVLKLALRYGCKVLIASTSEVYGKDVQNDHAKFSEDDDIVLGTSIRWGYACSKALDEYLARAYWRQKGLPIVIARIFNTVGPRQTPAYGMVIPRFVQQALRDEPITVYGDGKQVRSFCWVGDTVRALIGLMETPEVEGEIFNVGNDEPITIEELAIRIKEMTNSDSEIIYVPYECAYGSGFEDIRYRVPDISKIRQAIGYEPTLNLNEILERVIAYERRQLMLARR
ncbi:MAG: GDP-mannose 4,6-dehydratase [Armatimonadota bacterium]|nr:GDP-mannose 4,6-dehydratase [Armatimonadota bacterium]MDW8142491.1 GDP-mannose 4,6-dehydratase [Armatimonadota bacterium]